MGDISEYHAAQTIRDLYFSFKYEQFIKRWSL